MFRNKVEAVYDPYHMISMITVSNRVWYQDSKIHHTTNKILRKYTRLIGLYKALNFITLLRFKKSLWVAF